MRILKKNGGFTLVELIVVIAILAILAGVAIPAYSGYVKKAEQAGDEQLLAAINRAFNAACIEENIFGLKDGAAELKLTNGSVTGVTIKNMNGDLINKFNDTFEKYMDGTASREMKVYRAAGAFSYRAAVNGFVLNPSKSVKLSNGSVDIYYDEEDATALKNSILGQKDAAELAEDIDWVAQGVAGGQTVNLHWDEYYGQNDAFDVFCQNVMGKGAADIKESERVNAVMLYTAQQTSYVKTDEMLAYMMSEDYNGGKCDYTRFVIDANDETQMVASMAAQYALAYAFTQSDIYRNAGGELVEDPRDLINATDNDAYKTWLEQEGKATLDGYVGTMNIVNSNAGNIDVNALLENGFASDDIKALLGAFGGNN